PWPVVLRKSPPAKVGKLKNCILQRGVWMRCSAPSHSPTLLRHKKRRRNEFLDQYQNHNQTGDGRLFCLARCVRFHCYIPAALRVLYLHAGGLFRTARSLVDVLLHLAPVAIFVSRARGGHALVV